MRNISANTSDRYGWIIFGECDRDAAESFIQVMIDVQATPPTFRFTVPSFIDLQFRQHLVNFNVNKNTQEYAASGKKIVILN